MARVITRGIDYTDKDYESFRSAMLEELQKKIPEYTDLRESDAGVVLIELLAMGLDVLSFYQDIYANETYITTAEQKENIMKWCNILGYTPKKATSAKFKQVFELIGEQKTDTVIPKGTLLSTSTSSGENSVIFETESDLVIPLGKLGTEKDSLGNYLYYVTVSEGYTVSNELLGSSDATASQTFTLKNYPVILDETLSVFVDSGLGFEKWEMVDNFFDSLSTSKHFMPSENIDGSVSIIFGDGIFGMIPAYGKNNIYVSYRVGGGSNGNVGKNKITVLNDSLALVKSTFNPFEPFISGLDKESITQIKVNAPLTYKTFFGALTLKDFSQVIIRDFDAIMDAESKRDPENQDNIFIYVICKDAGLLSDELKNEILQYFDENYGGRKIVGADVIKIFNATFTPLDLKVIVKIEEGYSKDTVQYNITEYLNNFFKKGNYFFGTILSFSQLDKKIQEEIEGIQYIQIRDSQDTTKGVMSPQIGEVFTLKSISFD